MNKKFTILGIALIFIALALPLIIAREDSPAPSKIPGAKIPITDLYPEDYSFRTGLAYKITSYNENGIKIKEENNIWQTRYPFNNPREARKPYRFDETVTENIGFKVSIIRYPAMWNVLDTGRLSYTLAVIPYLAAKETIIYDDGGTGVSQTFGTLTKFDRYGNAKEIHNLGYTGKKPGETFTEPVYYEYEVRNPLRNDGKFPYIVSSEFTNLRTADSDPISLKTPELGLAKKDTTVTYNEFVYEIGGKNPEIAGHANIRSSYPIESSRLSNEKDAQALYAFYGITGIPKRTIVKDAYGRVLSDTETEFETLNANFETCSQGNHIAGNKCLITPGSGDYKSLNPFDDTFIGSSSAGEFCIRVVPRKVSSYGTAAGGYIALASGDKEHVVSSNTELSYDDCGNNVQLTVNANYVLPGSSSILTYSRTIQTEYDPKAIKPLYVTTLATPGSGVDDIVKSATYYRNNLLRSTTNERGIVTNYAYDILGRIASVWTLPDDVDFPTIRYIYNPNFDSFRSRNKILEERKNTNGLYTQTYYHYDGLGRFIQSKTLNDVGIVGDINDDVVIVAGNLYDSAGRAIRDFRPKGFKIEDMDPGYFGVWFNLDSSFAEEGKITPTINGGVFGVMNYILHEFDSQGREIRITDKADNSETTNDYSLLGDIVISSFFSKVSTTDPNGKVRTFYSDARGGLVKVVLPTP